MHVVSVRTVTATTAVIRLRILRTPLYEVHFLVPFRSLTFSLRVRLPPIHAHTHLSLSLNLQHLHHSIFILIRVLDPSSLRNCDLSSPSASAETENIALLAWNLNSTRQLVSP